MRYKCKDCNNLIEGVCKVFNRRRSSGKKRTWCNYFDLKVVEKKVIPIMRQIFQTKQDRRREKLLEEENLKMVRTLESAMEQSKITEEPTVEAPEVKVEPVKVKIKKENLLSKFKNKIWRSHY